MKLAVDLSKSVSGVVVNAAVIVDPSTNQVIASASDQVLSGKALMDKTRDETNCFEYHEEIAGNLHANGLEDCKTSNLLSNGDGYDDVSCLHPWRWSEQQHMNSCFCHPLQHAAMVAIEFSAARDRHLFPGTVDVADNSIEADNLLSFLTGPRLKRPKPDFTHGGEDKRQTSDRDGSQSSPIKPYLCTGYDIYLVWEPCPMCAMALVHQRMKRIFFAFPNPNAGALGSVHRLQGEKSLNHHYTVFRVLLPKDAVAKGVHINDSST